MADYEPSREVKLIELAWKIVEPLQITSLKPTQDDIIDARTKWFDKAYKALSKTVFGK